MSARRFDEYPPEAKEETQLYPFFENLKNKTLTTTQCGSCKTVLWPPRTICPKCIRSELKWVTLPTTGTVHLFTIATREKDQPPTVLAMVKLLEGVTIPSVIYGIEPEKVKIGMNVKFELIELGDGRVIYGFKPVE